MTNMTDVCDFKVIGELRDNPHHLLLLGNDGQCYAYDIDTGDIEPRDPDESWAVDVREGSQLRMHMMAELLAS